MKLSVHDFAELHHFFGTDGRDERSISGPILEVAALYSYREPQARPDYGDDPPAGIELLERLDARPTAETRQTSRDAPEIRVASARVRRRLGMLSREHQLVMAVFFGNLGDRMEAAPQEKGKRPPPGRLAALLVLVERGKKLLREQRQRERRIQGKTAALPGEQVVERALEAAAETVVGRDALGNALDECQALFDAACDAWNATAPAKPAAPRKAGA